MMKNLLEKLFENETLTYDESKSVLLEISAKKYDDSLIASFLTVYKMRMPCVEEIEGFRDALLDLLARTVEENPCRRENWVHLVNALGRVDATRKNECLHSEEATNQERQDWWWGKDRVSTWKEEFFNLPKSAIQAVKPEFVRIVSQVVESALVNSPSEHHINKEEETLEESSVFRVLST